MVSQSGKFQELLKFLQVQSQKSSSTMMKLAFMRTATGKKDPELPLLQRISSLELTVPQIAAQINASQSSSNRHISTSTVQRTVWIRPSWLNCCKETTTKRTLIRRRDLISDLLGPKNTSNGHLTGGNLSFGLMIPNLRFLVPTAVSLWDAE